MNAVRMKMKRGLHRKVIVILNPFAKLLTNA